MTIEFQVDVLHLDPFSRESLKRSIIDQGRNQRITVHIVTEASKVFSIALTGEHGEIQAYAAAVTSWINCN